MAFQRKYCMSSIYSSPLPSPPPLPPHTCTHSHSLTSPAHALLPQVFHQIVYGLREATSRSSLVDDKICEGYFFLAELCDMRPDSTNFRPICQLVRPLHLSTPTPSSSSPLPHTHTHTHTHTQSFAQTRNGYQRSRDVRLRVRRFLAHFSVSLGSWMRAFPSVVGTSLRATGKKTQRTCLTPSSRGLASVG